VVNCLAASAKVFSVLRMPAARLPRRPRCQSSAISLRAGDAFFAGARAELAVLEAGPGPPVASLVSLIELDATVRDGVADLSHVTLPVLHSNCFERLELCPNRVHGFRHKKALREDPKRLIYLVAGIGFEPMTFRL
jgi:hypothetical protein